MRVKKIEQPVIFDTDCLSSFAAFPDGIEIIKATLGDVWTSNYVIRELSESPDDVYIQVKEAEKSSMIGVYSLGIQGPDTDLFLTLTSNSMKPVMGDGEAAAIALVSVMGGTVASNNLRDIKEYCVNNNIQFICSDDILCLAVERKVISFEKASQMWDTMKKRVILPRYDFAEVLRRFLNDEER